MAGSAVGLVGGKGPRDHFVVAVMAVVAVQVGAMVARIVGAAVAEADAAPVAAVMATVTILGGDKVA